MTSLTRPVLAASTALLVLAVAGSANAKAPTFRTKTIVPGQAIGGVKIGMTKAQARKAWGKPDTCYDSPLWCQFRADSHINGSVIDNPFAG